MAPADSAGQERAATLGSPLRVVSSMATKPMLVELVRMYEVGTRERVALESQGGVDVARRVQAGAPFDVVILARDALEQLVSAGHLRPGSVVDLVHSEVAVAVRRGAPRPDIGSEAALADAVSSAGSVGLSTGPSGTALLRLFERWGKADELRERIVTAPPGVSVGSLVASGQVQLGFQQRSELIGMDGVDVLGPLPAALRIVTTFAAALGCASRLPFAAERFVAFLASSEVAEVKLRHGMQPIA